MELFFGFTQKNLGRPAGHVTCKLCLREQPKQSLFLNIILLCLELLAGDPCLKDPPLHDGGTKKLFKKSVCKYPNFDLFAETRVQFLSWSGKFHKIFIQYLGFSGRVLSDL
jgi:hypothetical protein